MTKYVYVDAILFVGATARYTIPVYLEGIRLAQTLTKYVYVDAILFVGAVARDTIPVNFDGKMTENIEHTTLCR